MDKDKNDVEKDIRAVMAAQLWLNVSFNFIMIFLPFYVLKISHLDARGTLIWTGFIMGSTSIAASIFSPFWGNMTKRINPKYLFETGLFVHAVLTFLMGLATNIYILFILRILQGMMGGISTIGLIIVSTISPRHRITFNIGLYQSFMTVGQLLGPPLGSGFTAILGFRHAFFLASALAFSILLYSIATVSLVPTHPSPSVDKRKRRKGFITGWFVSFSATIQLVFLPSVLPVILKGFNVSETNALPVAGLIVTAYGLSSVIGTVILTRTSAYINPVSIILFSGITASLLQFSLSFAGGLWSFGIIRVLQTAFISAIFPLVVARIVEKGIAPDIGYLNSARFAGNALGPIIATSVLSKSNTMVLFSFISIITIIPVLSLLISEGFKESRIKGFK